MLNQFSRTELLIGKEGMEKLKNSRVAVFGIGGVGGYTVEALVRSGVGTLDLIDDDKVCLTNINRQIYATRKTVGKYKVDVARDRILEINPDAVVNIHKTFYVPETADSFDFSHFFCFLFFSNRRHFIRRCRTSDGALSYPSAAQSSVPSAFLRLPVPSHPADPLPFFCEVDHGDLDRSHNRDRALKSRGLSAVRGCSFRRTFRGSR